MNTDKLNPFTHHMSELEANMLADIEATPDYPPPEPVVDPDVVTELHKVIGDIMNRQDEMNIMLGFALGQLVKARIALDPMLLDYLKRRGILT
jgi:hypothetical protein